MNPYSGAGFFEFFAILFQRICFGANTLAPDEIQLAVLSCCALGCGLIGPFLVLKRMTMFANSLSHTSLLGIVLAFLCMASVGIDHLGTLLLGALFSALLTAGLTEGLSRIFRLQEDASIGLVFTSLFSIGILLATCLTRNAHISTEAVLGNCDALQLSDLYFALFTALFACSIIVFFYRRLAMMAFDEPFAKTFGIRTVFWRIVLFFLTTVVCTASFRAIGVLVVLSLLTGPYLTARLFCSRLHRLLFWTPVSGISSCLIGVALSRAILTTSNTALSTGGIIALVIASQFALAAGCKTLLTRHAIVDK